MSRGLCGKCDSRRGEAVLTTRNARQLARRLGVVRRGARAGMSAGSIILAVVLALLAGGAGAALITALMTTSQARWADARALRDRRAERIRQAFRPVLQIAGAHLDVVRRQKFLLGSETTEQRDAPLVALLQEAQAGLTEAQVTLQLEPGVGRAIDQLFRETYAAYAACQSELGSRRETAGLPGAQSPKLRDLNELEAKARAAYDRLHAEMLRILDTLQQPLPPPLWARLRSWSPWRRSG